MSKDKINIDKVKEIPIIKDNRNKKSKNTSLIISNFEYLDAKVDKKEIEQRKAKKQEQLKNPFYSIDLNTNRVKQNNQATFILNTNKTIHNISDVEDIDKQLHNDYLKLMQKLDDILDTYSDKQYNTIDEIKKDIMQFNIDYDNNYYNGFNLRVKDYLDDDVKREHLNQYASAIASLLIQDIRDNYKDIKDILDVDLDKVNTDSVINQKWFKETQKVLKEYLDASDDNKQDIDIVIFNIIREKIYQEQKELLDATIQKHYDYYKKVNELYKSINDKILKIVNNFNEYGKKLKADIPNNYDITKYKQSNDIVSKIDPIAKDILSGKSYEVGKFIKTTNNYNDKNYGAVFSIKTAELSNIDIIQELQQKGIQITHFGKKVIDDIDILLDENKGNVNNNNRLVALTPKMIAKKVFNVKQPTKKQIQEIENELRKYSNIYLFFVKDDKTKLDIERLKQLNDKGLDYLQDEEGNVLNIGDALDDNLILNVGYGLSKQYQTIVYMFKDKSIFEKINQWINNDVGKQLKLGLKDKSDEIFNDYNKNVNKEIVGIRYFLFERVNQIKHSIENKQKTNKEIVLSNIYKEYDITTPKQKGKVRLAIKNILNYWIDINIINGYKFLDAKGNEIKKNSTTEIYKIDLDV